MSVAKIMIQKAANKLHSCGPPNGLHVIYRIFYFKEKHFSRSLPLCIDNLELKLK